MCATSALVVPVEGNVPLAATVSGNPNLSKLPPSSWRNLFASNRNTASCPRLIHYSAFTETRGCNLLDDDLDTKCDLWKMSLVGYITGRSPSFKALQNIIVNTWHCEASLTIHDSGWLIFKFANEEDKLNVLFGGPYLVYGRPLILRKCQNTLISLLLICILFRYGSNSITFLSSAGLSNVYLKLSVFLVNLFKVTCSLLPCQEYHMPGCWWK